MGGRDQSQVKIKFKKFEKVKSVPIDVPRSHNNDTGELEWCQLRGFGQSGLSGDNSPDNYWWPNLA